jgi:hypothetical protein
LLKDQLPRLNMSNDESLPFESTERRDVSFISVGQRDFSYVVELVCMSKRV